MIDQSIIEVSVAVTNREETFTHLANLVVSNGYASDVATVEEALKAREAEGTTGMMDGFAIPHAKSVNITKPGVAILKLAVPVEWDSMDGKPISNVVSLFIPEGEAGTTHLQLLSKVARLLMKQEFKEAFNAASTPEAVYEVLNRYLAE